MLSKNHLQLLAAALILTFAYLPSSLSQGPGSRPKPGGSEADPGGKSSEIEFPDYTTPVQCNFAYLKERDPLYDGKLIRR
ncbi:hypothetical protein O181_078566 [Austropuccinia psidii MF-1]|uniref:Uncharacterized protein n=1 Tax=Austropuccinia psidii MF-1 TaxID=1389203 RepID=A0A9Q3FK87_9BASI|nr:hypothetical protein [Austropuccinia psidii MF-1]